MLLSATALQERHLPDLDATDADAMDALGDVLAAVEAAAVTWLGVPLAPSAAGGAGVLPTLSSRTYVLFPRLPRPGSALVLPVLALSAITSIKRSLSADWLHSGADPDDVETYASTDYRGEPLSNGYRLHLRPSGALGTSWPRQAQTVRAIVVAGYASEAAAPPALVDAIYRWAADRWAHRRVRTTTNASQGGASQSFRELKVPADVAEDLAPWRVLGSLGGA